MKTPKIRMGLINESVKTQLENQGIEISEEEGLRYDRIIAAINLLYLNRITTKVLKDEQVRKMMFQLTTYVNMDEIVKDMSETLGKSET